MWPFNRKAPQPLKDWAGPIAFFDWTEEEIAAMSAAIRTCGQPDSDGWRRQARICLNVLRGGSAVELLAREIEKCRNPGHDPDRPIEGSHYLRGMPRWCMWVETARPAVGFIATRGRAAGKACST